MSKFEVEMPTEIEIKNQIDYIIDIALKKKTNFFSYLTKMIKELGLKNIFFNPVEIIQALSITTLYILLIRISFDIGKSTNKDLLYSIVFMVSPMFYILVNLFSLVKIKENNMYEIEMTCKYDIYQLISLRMLIFSFISIVFNSIIIIGLSNYIDVFRGIMISLSSLLLFSVISLYIFLNTKFIFLRFLFCILWIVLNLLLFKFNYTNYLNLLNLIPNIVYIAVIIVAGYMYLQNIKKLIEYGTLCKL